MAPALSCRESEEFLALAGLGVLAHGESAALDEHLKGCYACRREAVRYRATTVMLATGLEPLAPPAAVRHRLLQEVYAEARPQLAQNRRPERRRPRVRRFVLSLAGAGVAVAAAFVAINLPSSSTHAYTVFGTTTDPGVHGTLTYYRQQQQAVVTVSGLQSLVSVAGAPAPVYEVWLVRPNGTALGAAFLAQSPATRSWTTVIHADLSQFAAVAATSEPAGGSPEPTGPQLLNVQLTG